MVAGGWSLCQGVTRCHNAALGAALLLGEQGGGDCWFDRKLADRVDGLPPMLHCFSSLRQTPT